MAVIKVWHLRVERERTGADCTILPPRDEEMPGEDNVLGKAELLHAHLAKDSHTLNCEDRAICGGIGSGIDGEAACVIDNAVAYLHLYLFAAHLQGSNDGMIDGNMQGRFSRLAL